jgi:cobalt/nickel transport system ATP-binding protein
MADSEVVRARDLACRYPDGTARHFRGPDFLAHRGEVVLLLGPNGSGKSSLLALLMGLMAPSAGSLRVLGREPAREFEAIREQVGVLLQDPEQQILAPTVCEDIGFSPRNYGYAEAEVERRVKRVSQELEIEHLLDKVPHYLSGGEKLKVALAGALVLEPALLLLDEPFERLDTTSKLELCGILDGLRSRHDMAIILATHEVNLAPRFVDTVYLLAADGALAARGTPAEILGRPDLLAAHHLEPPVLVALFQALRARGIDLETSLTVDEAADRLARRLEG